MSFSGDHVLDVSAMATSARTDRCAGLAGRSAGPPLNATPAKPLGQDQRGNPDSVPRAREVGEIAGQCANGRFQERVLFQVHGRPRRQAAGSCLRPCACPGRPPRTTSAGKHLSSIPLEDGFTRPAHRGYREIALHDREHIRRAEPLSGEVVTPAGNREGSSRSCSTCKPLCLIFTKT